MDALQAPDDQEAPAHPASPFYFERGDTLKIAVKAFSVPEENSGSNAGFWHEMRRAPAPNVVPADTLASVGARLKTHAYVVLSMLGQSPSQLGYKGMSDAWQGFPTGPKIAPELWDLLGAAIASRDVMTVSTVWVHILSREPDLDGGLCFPEQIFANLHVAKTSRNYSALLCATEFLALEVRRPRLVLELLAAFPDFFGRRRFPWSKSGSKKVIANRLTTVALALLDAIFVPGTYVPDLEAWTKRFVDDEEKHAREDSLYYAAGWREVIRRLIDAAGCDVPTHVHVARRAQSQGSETRSVISGKVHILALAANGAAFDDFLFRRLMDDARGDYIDWTVNDLSDAFTSLAERDSLLPAEKHAEILSKLYGRLLVRLEQGGVDDPHAHAMKPWKQVLACAHSTGDELDDEVRSDACRWHDVLDAMAAQHNHLGLKEAHRSRPLFASLMRAAMCKTIGIRGNTHLVAHLMRLSAESATPTTPKQLQWLDIPRLAYIVACHHTELLAELLKFMRLSESGTPMSSLAEHHVDALQQALSECMLQLHNEASRQLVRALGPGKLPRTVKFKLDELDDGRKFAGFLVVHVQKLGKGADSHQRKKLGPDFANFLDHQVLKDFEAVLDAMDWNACEKEEALQQCTATKSGQGRPICARLLMARGTTPPSDSAYLRRLSEDIFRPGGIGAQAAHASWQSTLGKRPAAEAEGDGTRAKEARGSARE